MVDTNTHKAEQTSDNEENIDGPDTVTEKPPPHPPRTEVELAQNTNAEIVYFRIVRYITISNSE